MKTGWSCFEIYNDSNFNMLRAGFTDEQIEATNDFVCGMMTVEGAPHLEAEHYPAFDTANKTASMEPV